MECVINYELLDKAIDWFADYIVYMQKGGSIDFYNGYIRHRQSVFKYKT